MVRGTAVVMMGGSWRMTLTFLIASAALAAARPGTILAGPAESASSPAERRALAFLAREVPRWSRENHCYSCHNNGDAARALLAARKKGATLRAEVLDDTLAFLARPERWDRNGVDAAFSDKKLARLQFANALAASVSAGAVADRAILIRAARRLVGDQEADGSWKVDDGALVGSPTTYGPPLATAMARTTLAAADVDEFGRAIEKADRWLLDRPARNVLDASAVLIGLGSSGTAADAHRAGCLDLLRRAQSEDGGWGPFVSAPPETFDTAIALIALARSPDTRTVSPMIARGRAYLVRSQSDDGSWPETTRPSGGESYAQRLSTTGWAIMALLATNP